MTTAMTHYAKGVALAATGRVQEAEAERTLFVQAVSRVVPTRMLFNNTCLDILAIAGAMLDGELAYRKGDHDAAFAAPAPLDRAGRRPAVRRAVGLDAADPARVRRAAAGAGARGRGRRRLRSGPRPRRHAAPPAAAPRTTCGPCTATTSASRPRGVTTRRGSSPVSSLSPPPYADVPINASCFCRLSAQRAHGDEHCCD